MNHVIRPTRREWGPSAPLTPSHLTPRAEGLSVTLVQIAKMAQGRTSGAAMLSLFLVSWCNIAITLIDP